MDRKAVAEWKSWDDAPSLLTTSEVSELFRMDPRTLGDIVSAGLLNRGKIGRGYRYTRAEVQRFAQNQKIDPFPELKSVSR